jgi:hypothetical protein
MTDVAILMIIVAFQGGLFLLMALILWHKIDTLRLVLLRLSKQVEQTRVRL